MTKPTLNPEDLRIMAKDYKDRAWPYPERAKTALGFLRLSARHDLGTRRGVIQTIHSERWRDIPLLDLAGLMPKQADVVQKGYWAEASV
jgi:hypothetical protein